MKYFFLGVCLVMVISVAFADPHTRPYDDDRDTIIETTVNHYSTEKAPGIALGVAQSQLQFDKNISNWQMGVGMGSYDNSQGYAFGAAKQIGEKSIINFSVGREGNQNSYGAGLNWTLK